MSDKPQTPDKPSFFIGLAASDLPPDAVPYFTQSEFDLIIAEIEAEKVKLIDRYPSETNFIITVIYSADRFTIRGDAAPFLSGDKKLAQS